MFKGFQKTQTSGPPYRDPYGTVWHVLRPAFSTRVRHHHRNSLRRVLLSSIEGAAITAVRIEGVEHEFSPIPGVVEMPPISS